METFTFTCNTKQSGHKFKMRLVSRSSVLLQPHPVAWGKEGAYGEKELVRLRAALLSEEQGSRGIYDEEPWALRWIGWKVRTAKI